MALDIDFVWWREEASSTRPHTLMPALAQEVLPQLRSAAMPTSGAIENYLLRLKHPSERLDVIGAGMQSANTQRHAHQEVSDALWIVDYRARRCGEP